MTELSSDKPELPVFSPFGETSREQLGDQLWNAHEAIVHALHKVGQLQPNGRDYVVSGEEALFRANLQHQSRVARLTAVADEIMSILVRI